MPKFMQYLMLALGVVALGVLLLEIGLSIAATQHGATPAKTLQGNVGPYPLTLKLYTYPANAGFALPFSIAPQQPSAATAHLTYDVTSVPGPGLHATAIHGSVTPDPNVAGGVQGTVEITVQGQWYLDIVVNGPAGPAEIAVPVTATAPPAIPKWLGWSIGLIPLYGLIAFLVMQRNRNKRRQNAASSPQKPVVSAQLPQI